MHPFPTPPPPHPPNPPPTQRPPTHPPAFPRTHARTHPQGNFAVHKWYGIILNKVSEFQGTSATIKNSFIVKEHWAKVCTRACLRQSTAAHRAMRGSVGVDAQLGQSQVKN
jgi:hypothetical protein